MSDQKPPEADPEKAPADEPAPFAPPQAPDTAPADTATTSEVPVVVEVPEAAEPVAATPTPAPEPTPTVSAADASYSRPVGSAAPGALSPDAYADRPEVLVGAAFAGGMLAALILKRLAR